MASSEIIDLTVSSPPPSGSADVIVLDSTPTPGPRKKRRRKTSAPATPSAASVSSKSRDPSVEKEDRKTKRKKKRSSSKDGESKPVEEQTQTDEQQPLETVTTTSESQSPFFIDIKPTTVNPATRFDPVSAPPIQDADVPSDKLLLPAHVVVLGTTPFEIIAPPTPSDSDEEDFIKYLDYDDATDIVRYFHEAPDEAAQIERTVCKNCGVEGQHKTRDCPVMICLTCGARDEHSTRSCPISKTCFNCGMKGHINVDCPNRGSKVHRYNREYECERCSAPTHKTNECPTWWRLYEYVDLEEQTRILALRQSKGDLELGKGGEGFVADDEWCYNCGESGHLGDDCDSLPYHLRSEERSAFGKMNVMNGPFYDPDAPKASSSRSLVRDWAKFDKVSGINAEGVGKQGRLKTKAAMQKRQARQDDEDEDAEDWFGKSGNSKPANERDRAPPTGPKKMAFGKSIGAQFRPPSLPERPSAPSLLERMGGGGPKRDSRSDRRSDRKEHHQRDTGYRRKDRDRDRDDDRDRGRRDDSRSLKPPAGPRYRGGYGR